jgi:hypothetical protein
MRDHPLRRAPVDRRRPTTAAAPDFKDAPTSLLICEWQLLQGALARTREAGDKAAEQAALRCIDAVETELLTREECA